MTDLRILRFDELESTNTEAISQARRGAAEGLCVVARRQTAGRGRAGRRWISEDGAGLYASLVLRPGFESRHFPIVTLAAAVAVACSLGSEFGISCDIKWPNDVLAGKRKISGILAETTETLSGTAVIVGIGVNLLASAVSSDISGIATSVESETGSRPDQDDLLGPLLRHFFFQYEKLSTRAGRAEVLSEWATRSSFHKGKEVRVTLDSRVLEGVTDGIDENGSLIVRTGGGEAEVVQAGDVTSVRD